MSKPNRLHRTRQVSGTWPVTWKAAVYRSALGPRYSVRHHALIEHGRTLRAQLGWWRFIFACSRRSRP